MVNASQAVTQANPDDLVAIAKKMDGPSQNLQAHLKGLTDIQGILEAAFKGNAGQAVYNAFGNVHSTGSQVAQYLESVMAQINSASSKFGNEDDDARKAIEGIVNGMGAAADGTYNSGVRDEGWQSANAESTVGPSKAKVDWA
ncbi:WXG100 family type VII secretion target [Nocardia fusca]|uniref:WXG100 family type VII secretion target n=1 Tax=Nocardia fusca TaxID=941183 RepID=UPI0007A75B99|nr:WXG100 family type VII secretion target [Nocardia fusca]